MSYSTATQAKRDPSVQSPPATISSGSRVGKDSIPGTQFGTFAGDVWIDPMLESKEAFIALVNFSPRARTNWHWHEKGQLLRVTGGSGWYCDQGKEPKRINAGDTVWCPPGVVHWHGADDGTYMVHEAATFGKIEWYEPVDETEYAAKK